MTGDPFEPGLLARLPEPPRRVALLRPSRLGDLICATPALRALRRALPGALITLITLPILRDAALRSPHVDRYADFPGFPGIAEQLFDPRRALRFFAAMQAERFDLAVQMYGSGLHANPCALLLGARATAGFVQGEWAGRLDAALPIPQQGHEVDRVLALVRFLGAPAQGRHTEFHLRAGDHARAERLLAGYPPPFVGLHLGAWAPERVWPPTRLGAAGAAVRGMIGGTVVVLGGAHEGAAAACVAARAGEPCVNLAGHTSLAALGAVIAGLRLLIANDSGPAHVAYALGTPTVTLFGRASPARYGPPVPGAQRLIFGPEGHAGAGVDPPEREIERITVEEVVAAAADLLRSGRAGAPAARAPM